MRIISLQHATNNMCAPMWCENTVVICRSSMAVYVSWRLVLWSWTWLLKWWAKVTPFACTSLAVSRLLNLMVILHNFLDQRIVYWTGTRTGWVLWEEGWQLCADGELESHSSSTFSSLIYFLPLPLTAGSTRHAEKSCKAVWSFPPQSLGW